MIVMNLKGECINNKKWFELYEHHIQLMKTTDITLLLLMMFDWSDVKN